MVQRTLSLIAVMFVSLQKLEEQDRKALNVKEQLQREHRYLKRRLEQLSVSGSVERIRTDSMGSTISTDSEQGALAVNSEAVVLNRGSTHPRTLFVPNLDRETAVHSIFIVGIRVLSSVMASTFIHTFLECVKTYVLKLKIYI